MVKYSKRKYYEKLPCKMNPDNEGLGCCQPRVCSKCGWNPHVAKRRSEMIQRKRKEATA